MSNLGQQEQILGIFHDADPAGLLQSCWPEESNSPGLDRILGHLKPVAP